MRKSIIVAAAQNGVIGKDGQLPWKLPGDMKRFRALTMGHVLVMGRKTYESIGRPLPGRSTIILSRSDHPGVLDSMPTSASGDWVLEKSLPRALQFAEHYSKLRESIESEVFICGGGEVYREALPLVDRVYLTVVERDFEGDTFLPEAINGLHRYGSWNFVGTERGEGELPHRFETWERVR